MSLIRIAIMIFLLMSIRNCDPGMPPMVDSLLASPTATSRDDSVSEEKSAPPTNEATAADKELAQNDPALEPAVREGIATSQRTIEADEKRLDALKQELADPDGEYNQAQKAFKDIDTQLNEKKQQLEELEKEKGEAEAAPLRAEVKTLDTSWKLAKDRLQLATKERQTLQAKMVALEQKIQQDRKALLRLIGGERPSALPAEPATPATTSDTGSPNEAKEGPATLANSETHGAANSALEAETKGLLPPNPLAPPTQRGTPQNASDKALHEQIATSPELIKAKAEAQKKLAAAEQAKSEARTVARRMETLRTHLKLEMDSLANARQKEDNALQARLAIDEQLQALVEQDASAKLEDLQQKRASEEQRFKDANAQVTQSTARLNDLQTELSSLLPQKNQAEKRLQQKQQEADAAHQKVLELQNPYALRNLWHWLIVHGPRLLGILLIAGLLMWVGGVVRDRLVDLLTRRLDRGGKLEREARAQTLIGVCHNAANVAIVFGATTMFLSEMGVDVSVVVGGAAVIGLAVAFGAQNLIRDYFYGFVILLENQYRVGDVISIGQVSGVVERVTLRITVLRGEDGTLNFVPNGQILTVGNKTHGWSRALFEIPIGYREDPDYVINILREIGQELRKSPGYEMLIVDDPEMLGVDALGDSAVIIKFLMKTQPTKQWKVKREMLRRIKKRFDELNIEIPLPQRTIHYRNDNESPDLDHQGHEAVPRGASAKRNGNHASS